MLTVVTTADSYDLALIGTMRTALDVPGSDQSLALLLTQASAAISKYCNRVFARETLSETFRLTCRDDGLMLARTPVVSITSVVENEITLDSACDYELIDKAGIVNRLRSDRQWQWPVGKTVVTYVAGWAIADMPADLVRATIMLVGFYLNRDGSEIMTRSSDIPGVESRSFQDFPLGSVLPPEIEGMINQFRKPAGA